MNANSISDFTAALDTFIRDSMPLADAMDLHLLGHDQDSLTLGAPLTPNVNDKGCAFGGSLSSLMTLAGWAFLVMRLHAESMDCDVFVAQSDARYLAPVWSGFSAQARLAPDSSWPRFVNTLRRRGKARIAVSCHIPGDTPDRPAATMQAAFVAKRRCE